MTSWFSSICNSFLGSGQLISEEKMEEYRMLSGFKTKDIYRIYKAFQKYTNDSEKLSKETFLNIEGIQHNPLKDRIAFCFGFDEEKGELDFVDYLSGLAQFNSPGKREQKVKTAFKIQDFDGDGQIDKNDLIKYMERISGGTLNQEEIESISKNTLIESSSDPKQEFLSFADFQRVVAPSDFQSKLLLPI
jgi:Ca2+-binding EF-hand superfamily protein